MKRHAMFALVVIALAGPSAMAGARHAAMPGQGEPARATGVIRGRIVAAHTGAPVRGARVRLSGAMDPLGAVSDADGVFEITGVPAGRWNLHASKAGFVSLQFGQRSPFDSAEPIAVGAGELATANFALTPGGAMTGLVFDEFGDPAAGVYVQVARIRIAGNARRLAGFGTAVPSDDTGAYRVYGIPPGEYYVSANEGVAVLSVAGVDAIRPVGSPVAYARTYFPGATNIADAQRIAVVAGQTQTGINLTLIPARPVQIAGRVVNSKGAPLQAMVRLDSASWPDDLVFSTSSVGTTAAGTFTLSNVLPGNYELNVTGRIYGDDPPEAALVPIAVGDRDLEVSVLTTQGSTVSGTVVTDDGTSVPPGARIVAQSVRTGAGLWTPRAPLAGGSFELQGLVGQYALRVESLPPGWAVKSIASAAGELADRPLEFGGSEHVAVHVVLTERLPELVGVVRSGDRPADRARIVVFPDDPSKWSVVSRYLRAARADTQGTFVISGLPPDERYLAIALDWLEPGEHLDPEFLERMRPRATTFSLAEAEKKALDLELVPR